MKATSCEGKIVENVNKDIVVSISWEKLLGEEVLSIPILKRGKFSSPNRISKIDHLTGCVMPTSWTPYARMPISGPPKKHPRFGVGGQW